MVSQALSMTEYPTPELQTSPLSDAAIGAVTALVRVSELYDPAVAHRAALRAVVASRLAEHIDSSVDRSAIIATAVLIDIDLTITRPNEPEDADDTTRPLLAATLLARLPGLRDVATCIRSHGEWWDGSGGPDGIAGETIPAPARLAAIADVLVGAPAAGFVPSWAHARKRVQQLAGTKLDPTMAQVAVSIELNEIEASPIPSDVVAELLKTNRFIAPVTDPADTATTVKVAIASAGEPSALVNLFAEIARSTVAADEVFILRSTDTAFDEEPVAHVVADSRPRLPSARLDAVFEFSRQAELRAGVSTIDSSDGSDHQDQLFAPIMIDTTCWGALVALRGDDRASFEEHDLSALRHIATEASTAVVKTEHWAQMERMALRDQLTGLANRHELYRVLDEIFRRPPLERVDVALIMCDVDGLKVVNDSLGHQAGDRLLIDAAAAMRGAVRDPERTTVCRIGGDEFCMVIDGGALLTAYDVSDSIERLFARSGGSGEARSISCGIAFASEHIASRSALLRAADENQYETKRARKADLAAQSETAVTDQAPVQDRRALRDAAPPL